MDSYASPELQLSCARTRKRDMGGGTFIYLYGVRNNSFHSRHKNQRSHSQKKRETEKINHAFFEGKKRKKRAEDPDFLRLECAGDARPSWTARYLTRRGFKSSDHPTWGPAHAAGRQPVRARPLGVRSRTNWLVLRWIRIGFGPALPLAHSRCVILCTASP